MKQRLKQWIKRYQKSIKIGIGALMGLINGFYGSGGGIIAVQAMETMGVEQKNAHATSILAILPLSVASGIVYYLEGSLVFDANAWFLLGGSALGGFLGALLLGKLKGEWVNLLFTILILASGIRMVF